MYIKWFLGEGKGNLILQSTMSLGMYIGLRELLPGFEYFAVMPMLASFSSLDDMDDNDLAIKKLTEMKIEITKEKKELATEYIKHNIEITYTNIESKIERIDGILTITDLVKVPYFFRQIESFLAPDISPRGKERIVRRLDRVVKLDPKKFSEILMELISHPITNEDTEKFLETEEGKELLEVLNTRELLKKDIISQLKGVKKKVFDKKSSSDIKSYLEERRLKLSNWNVYYIAKERFDEYKEVIDSIAQLKAVIFEKYGFEISDEHSFKVFKYYRMWRQKEDKWLVEKGRHSEALIRDIKKVADNSEYIFGNKDISEEQINRTLQSVLGRGGMPTLGELNKELRESGISQLRNLP
jgi:hypothetical protein